MDRASNEDVIRYTQDEIIEEIVQLEDCYRRFVLGEDGKMPIREILVSLSGYDREALKYLDSNRDNWEFIIKWVDKRLDELPSIKRDTKEEKKYVYDIIEEVKEIRLKASPSFCPTCELRKMRGE